MQIHIDLLFYLHLVWADVELAEDVAEEVLDLVPGVDTVGAIQHDHDVHVCGAPCHVGVKKIFGWSVQHVSLPQCVCVCADVWLLCAVGAMVSLGSRSSLTDAQMPVLNIDVPHSWDHSGAQACQTHTHKHISICVTGEAISEAATVTKVMKNWATTG